MLEKFQQTFGRSWEEVLNSGKLKNLADAMQNELAGLTPAQIADLCVHGISMKLLPGTYVAKVNEIFVINGFYANMVSSWKEESAKVFYYVVTWDEQDLSWTDFRSKVIGSTDPTKAEPKSIRKVLLEGYETSFLLKMKPNTTFNGVHASAGPIEGARECRIWSKMPSTYVFLLHYFAKRTNVPEEIWDRAMNNEKIVLKDGNKGLIFDITEGVSAQRALDILKEMAGLL